MDVSGFLGWLLGLFPPLVRDVIRAGLSLEVPIQQMNVGDAIESDPPAYRNQWGKRFEYRVSVRRTA